ncbi:TPA: isopeptide-forming domain-containing fimbrial protein [Enterococcus hirae]|uniref:Cell wall surface anchor family protein n=1 Tax=Enterococcus hirae TaxID=1354 RepID=A0A7Z9AYC0_ENTHR|nr:isopeptide-forming domain-containing fimbrial protein [Enterococcus hirae]EOH67491.1 hypothetical protein UAE_02720 [Enterococcus hirae ATCC 9790]EOU03363.1 hypothetical protein I584_02736 [Enterococcus hirae ATCC 9790]OJG49229.1 hypothetical protein RV05_GL001359 [Enterococcus hirae]QQY20802.1 isopeptide-forming domain-containing fimbrial protein [Enterococcus hirae]VTQ74109.1 cell wall surface anchor family protein [Enterococcus hirae]
MNQYNKIKKSLLIGATILGITANSSVILATTNSGSSAGSLEKGVTLNSNQLKQARKLTQNNNTKKLVDDDNTTVVSDNTTISPEYSFFVQYIQGKTTVETFGEGWSEGIHTAENEKDSKGISIPVDEVVKGKTGVIYHHVSAFGQDVDARFTIKDYKEAKDVNGNTASDGTIAFNTSGQVGAYQNRINEATYTVEFLKAGTNEPISLDGFYTFSDIDWTQYITLHKDMLDKVTGVLADSTCWLDLTENEDGSKTFAETENQGSDDYDLTAMFTVLFKDLSKFDVTFGAADTVTDLPVETDWGAWDWFGNTAVKPAKSEDPNPTKAVTDKDETNVVNNHLDTMSDTFTFNITQNILGELPQFYHTSFEMKDELIPELERTSDVRIVDETGKDRTHFFTDKSKDNVIDVVATEEALKNQEFYGHTYTFSFDAKVREGMSLEKYYDKEDNKYHFPNQAKTIINGKEKPTNETDTDIDETPDNDPVKKIIDSEGKEVDLTQAKQGDTVEFVISNPEGVPYSAIGQKVTISDDLEDVLQLEDKTVKVEVADLGEDAEFKDVTDQGTLTTDDKTGKVSWSVDGSLLAGKQYRLTIGGTVKENVDFSSYVDDSGNITIPNVAHQIIGETDKPTNEVNVVVEQEKPRILPPTSVKSDNGQNMVIAGFSGGLIVLGLSSVVYLRGKKKHEINK